MSPEEIKKRTQVDSENFPPLVQEVKPVEKEEEETTVAETEAPKGGLL